MTTFGKYWRQDVDIDWYRYIYHDRATQHKQFYDWMTNLEHPITSVCEIGCGLGLGYAEMFRNLTYTGIDLSPIAVQYCQTHYPYHTFIQADVITNPPPIKADLVFSHGTIDNVNDMNTFALRHIEMSNKYIYISAYRGYFPQLKKHTYSYDNIQGVYYNDLSPYEIFLFVMKYNCHSIHVYSIPTGKLTIPFETIITAEVYDG